MVNRKSPILLVGAVFGLCLVACFGLGALLFARMTTTVMTKPSPDGRHTATLKRTQGIDVIFRVYMDGELVYTSPDFAPVPADFREQINWDADSRAIVLEVADRRIFGYDVDTRRALSDAELRAVEFTPIEELGFEGADAAAQGE